MGEMKAATTDFQVARVVGENDEGMTLFVPKNREGVFQVAEGDRFLTLMFIKDAGDGTMKAWVPWAS